MPTADLPMSTLSKISQRLFWLGRDIKISHSVFALPFALLATFLAAGSRGQWPGVVPLGLVVLCMFFARTMAMAINRWADARLDAVNPRTAGRAIPAGRLSERFVLGAAGMCAGLLVVSAGGFWLWEGNVWPVVFSPLVVAWLAAYSFVKRVSWLCHLFLGGALALSPLAAVLAIEPGFLGQADAYLLAGMVICWVAGFDVIYALQDVEADRALGLFSMPAKLGVEPALWVARGLHLLAFLALVELARRSELLGNGFRLGLVMVAGLLVVEHVLVFRSKTHHIHLAFFTLNGVISLLLGAAGIFDVVRKLW
ncbi:MAG: UbiA family prenyltransferase [Phycisphaeraceae bacterium]|nr:UbiA family prenyltransferase [Phycisphaeraceae bacterium]